MQNPYYIDELRQLSGPHRLRPRLRPRPARRAAVPRVPPRVPRLRPAGLRRRGQDAPDDRARLHRRLPPLDRPDRGARPLAARAGLRVRSRCSTASSSGPDGPRDAGTTRGSRLNLRRWLTPGIGVKRWLLVVFAGLVLLALGVAHLIRQATRDLQPGGIAQVVPGRRHAPVPAVPAARPRRRRPRARTRRGRARTASARALTEPFRSTSDGPLVEVIYQKRFLARGPRIVAIGGGTGLSTLLRGLKEHTSNLTAVVAVADDGGSSRRAPRGARDPARRRHPALHRRPGRRRAADERAAPVPLPGLTVGGDAGERRRARRPRGRQPPARGDDRGRGRRLRGGRSAR